MDPRRTRGVNRGQSIPDLEYCTDARSEHTGREQKDSHPSLDPPCYAAKIAMA